MDRIWQDLNNMDRPIVGLDFKTVSVGVEGETFLSLGVVATTSQIGVFDLASSDVIILESGLKGLLENDKVTKVKFWVFLSKTKV